jgi:CO/xanthine dehydrogenase Mo-binding subunit
MHRSEWNTHNSPIAASSFLHNALYCREESILGHCKRHPFRIFTRWGATKGGKIVAAEVKLLADGGAYKFTTSIVTSNALINARDLMKS